MTGRAAFLTSLGFVMELRLITNTEALCALRSVIASQTTADAITDVYNTCVQRLPRSKSVRHFRPTGSNDLNMEETATRERGSAGKVQEKVWDLFASVSVCESRDPRS